MSPDFATAAHEDVWHYLWKESQLPANVDPLDSKLEQAEERKRLAKVFTQGLDRVVGYVLPLRPSPDGAEHGWEGEKWRLRREHLYLIPGDSAMGFRLPLDSLLWSELKDRQFAELPDPLAPRAPLPRRPDIAPAAKPAQPVVAAAGQMTPSTVQFDSVPMAHAAMQTRQAAAGVAVDDPAAWLETNGHGETNGFGSGLPAETERNGEPHDTASPQTFSPPQTSAPLRVGVSSRNTIRTAICIEPREGRLHVFMPPTIRLEDYLALITAVEETAAELWLPVVVEGYLPPNDHRLNNIKVTPDPGVIEVNIQPAHNWDELVSNTSGLYHDARQSRLGTEKFMQDGRHTGTGGGNHVVLGGATPADSPFLRRPDLLRIVAGLLEQPSVALVFVFRHVRRADESIAAGRRGASR